MTGGRNGVPMSDRDWIVDRIGAPAFDQLATGLAGSDLHSVLLEVMQRRAASRSPGDVLAHYERDPFCAPAIVDLRESLAVDGHLLAAADGFEALGLSPVAPLGVSSAVAHTSQNRVLSSLRMLEVVSDPTNVLALECARRLRANWDTPVHLATCHRVLRAQPAPRLPGHPNISTCLRWPAAGAKPRTTRLPCDTAGPAHPHDASRARAAGTARLQLRCAPGRHPHDVRANGRRRSSRRTARRRHGPDVSGARLLLGWAALPDLGHRTRRCRGSPDRRRRLRLADQARCQPPGRVHRDRRGRSADRFALSEGEIVSSRQGGVTELPDLKNGETKLTEERKKKLLGARSARKGGVRSRKTQAWRIVAYFPGTHSHPSAEPKARRQHAHLRCLRCLRFSVFKIRCLYYHRRLKASA